MISLEDDFNDVISKAQKGLKLSDAGLAGLAGVAEADVVQVRKGHFDETLVRKLAVPLHLGPDALVAIGGKAWLPPKIVKPAGLSAFVSSYGDMVVNSYSVWDAESGRCVFFDTGADSTEMLNDAAQRRSGVQAILITHTHPDHVADLARTITSCGARAWVCELEPMVAASSFVAGHVFTLGGIRIETRQTSGHSRGGMTYVIHGLSEPVAIVGDSIFAGSMGGANDAYQEALRNNREKILTLPGNTILCPGHGPLTTVGEERLHNPFFAGE